ncbi:MAG: hypothetical protein QM493_05330 [Sulfurovum sp.]
MSKDAMLEDANLEFESFKEKQIDEWIENGANPLEAEQLFDEMVNDPYYSDPDMDVFSDYSINERIKLYTKT